MSCNEHTDNYFFNSCLWHQKFEISAWAENPLHPVLTLTNSPQPLTGYSNSSFQVTPSQKFLALKINGSLLFRSHSVTLNFWLFAHFKCLLNYFSSGSMKNKILILCHLNHPAPHTCKQCKNPDFCCSWLCTSCRDTESSAETWGPLQRPSAHRRISK